MSAKREFGNCMTELEPIIDELKNKGYELVSISNLDEIKKYVLEKKDRKGSSTIELENSESGNEVKIVAKIKYSTNVLTVRGTIPNIEQKDTEEAIGLLERTIQSAKCM